MYMRIYIPIYTCIYVRSRAGARVLSLSLSPWCSLSHRLQPSHPLPRNLSPFISFCQSRRSVALSHMRALTLMRAHALSGSFTRSFFLGRSLSISLFFSHSHTFALSISLSSLSLLSLFSLSSLTLILVLFLTRTLVRASIYIYLCALSDRDT